MNSTYSHEVGDNKVILDDFRAMARFETGKLCRNTRLGTWNHLSNSSSELQGHQKFPLYGTNVPAFYATINVNVATVSLD